MVFLSDDLSFRGPFIQKFISSPSSFKNIESYYRQSEQAVGLGAASQPWIAKGERSLSPTRIAAMVTVTWCTLMKSWRHFLNLKGSRTN